MSGWGTVGPTLWPAAQEHRRELCALSGPVHPEHVRLSVQVSQSSAMYQQSLRWTTQPSPGRWWWWTLGDPGHTQSRSIIKGDCVEVVHTYKYLGVQLDDKLDWTANTDALCRKGQSRLYFLFLRRLASFNICKKLLQIYHQSVVASALLYAVVCWGGGSLKKKDKQTHCAPGQTGEEGRLCRWHRAGQPDICGRATDAEQAPVHHGQSKSSTAQRHLQAEEQLQ
ncbi:hypothetical protein L3Q82_025602 [Scortum barcoo]|uniref:Uncharacterized protein n=1 Tax=Scortum barcoo TaxID=214431 RepID=A0ACB8WLD3_9TELE|nr:hypothetical protein L3Q82_025602 [Scortum barcoo]